MSYPVQTYSGLATTTIGESSHVLAVLKNYHGRVVSLFSHLPAEKKWSEVAKRIMILVSIPFIYPILGGLTLINFACILLNKSLINMKCHSVFEKLLGLDSYEVHLELRPESTDQWETIKLYISIGDMGNAKRLATFSCIIPSDGSHHHPQWFKEQIEQQIPTFSREIKRQYFPLKFGLPEVVIEVFVKRLDGTFTSFHRSSISSGGPGGFAALNATELEDHIKNRFRYIDLPYSPQLNDSFNFQ
ncbi:MAG: hypothetical protein Tsb0021_18250 [Chlamydiales bacterium]